MSTSLRKELKETKKELVKKDMELMLAQKEKELMLVKESYEEGDKEAQRNSEAITEQQVVTPMMDEGGFSARKSLVYTKLYKNTIVKCLHSQLLFSCPPCLPYVGTTLDQSALILDNTVSVFKAGNDKPVYTNTVRVVSRAGEAEDLVAHWKQEDGKRLREESASLFRQSVDIVRSYALAPASAATASAHRTFRYLEGKVDAIERAEPLSEQCGRALVKNLRGWLMSIPLKRARPAAPECAAPAESPTL